MNKEPNKAHRTPEHYLGKGTDFDVIDFIKAYDINFNLGNVIKYVSRAGRKSSESKRDDLLKAIDYLNRELDSIFQEEAKEEPFISDEAFDALLKGHTVFAFAPIPWEPLELEEDEETNMTSACGKKERPNTSSSMKEFIKEEKSCPGCMGPCGNCDEDEPCRASKEHPDFIQFSLNEVKEFMKDFLDDVRKYEHEAGKSIQSDERDSSEFVEIYFKSQKL